MNALVTTTTADTKNTIETVIDAASHSDIVKNCQDLLEAICNSGRNMSVKVDDILKAGQKKALVPEAKVRSYAQLYQDPILKEIFRGFMDDAELERVLSCKNDLLSINGSETPSEVVPYVFDIELMEFVLAPAPLAPAETEPYVPPSKRRSKRVSKPSGNLRRQIRWTREELEKVSEAYMLAHRVNPSWTKGALVEKAMSKVLPKDRLREPASAWTSVRMGGFLERVSKREDVDSGPESQGKEVTGRVSSSEIVMSTGFTPKNTQLADDSYGPDEDWDDESDDEDDGGEDDGGEDDGGEDDPDCDDIETNHVNEVSSDVTVTDITMNDIEDVVERVTNRTIKNALRKQNESLQSMELRLADTQLRIESVGRQAGKCIGMCGDILSELSSVRASQKTIKNRLDLIGPDEAWEKKVLTLQTKLVSMVEEVLSCVGKKTIKAVIPRIGVAKRRQQT